MEKAILQGYICVVRTKSILLKHRGERMPFKEMIEVRAFDESLNKYGNVGMTFNHNRIIADKKDIELYEDNVGLYYRVNVDDIEVIAEALSGKLTGCSFKFIPTQESKQYITGEPIRMIEKMVLLEVSILDKVPSYRSSIEIVNIPNELLMKANEYRVRMVKGNTMRDYERRLEAVKKRK